jgi:hypothetical protein
MINLLLMRLFLYFWNLCAKREPSLAEELIIHMAASLKTQRVQENYNKVVLG